jgi:predicted aspartyl protease
MKNILLTIAFTFAATLNFFGQGVTELGNSKNFRTIAGTINQQPIRFVFDTGANRTVLTPRAAKRLNLTLTGSETVNTAKGEVKAKSGNVQIDIDGHKASVEILVTDFAAMRGIEAILGTDFLQNFNFLFDSEKNTVCFDCTLPAAAATITGTAYDGRFQIPVMINDSTRLFLIDTGAAELTVFQRMGAQLLTANINNFSDDIYKKINLKIADKQQRLNALYLPPSSAATGGLIPAKLFKKLFYEKATGKFYLYL